LKRGIQISWLLVAALTLWLLVHLIRSQKNTQSYSITEDLSGFIDQLKEESDDIFETIVPISFDTETSALGAHYKNEKWYILHYDSTQPTYWNSNKIALDTSILKASYFPVIYKFGDDLYAIFKHPSNTFLAFRLANDGKPNYRLHNYIPQLRGHHFSTNELPKISKSFVFEFRKVVETEIDFISVALAISYLLLFIILVYLRNRDLKMYIAMALVFVIQIATFLHLPYPITDFYLLSTASIQNVAAEHLIPLLFIHLASIITLGIIAIQVTKKLPVYAATPILTASLIFLADFFIDLSKRLALRSSISFDFEKLFGLSALSFLALVFISLSLMALWMLCYYSKIKELITYKSTWIGICIGVLGFILFQYFDASRSLTSLSYPILLVAAAIFLHYRIPKVQTAIYLYFFLTAIITSTIAYSSQQQRQNTFLETSAQELIDNKDYRAERILKSFENQLSQEFLTPTNFQDFVANKDRIENRIKHLYFSNYLEKYKLKLFTFSPNQETLSVNSPYTYADLDSVYNNNTKRTASAYFYQIDNPISLNGYIAKYENCNLEGHFGTTFILLQPRVVQSEFLYPEIFENQKSEETITLDDFSYGLYFNNLLVSQKGGFPYLLNKTPQKGNNSIFALGKIRHKTFKKGNYLLVLSKAENRLRTWLSILTFTITLLLAICVLISLGTYFMIDKTSPIATAFLPGTSTLLSARIQASLTIILLLGLLFSVYIVITIVKANYNTSLENQLLTTVKSINSQLQNKIDLKEKLNNDEQRTLLLNQTSSTYNVDINLYDINGNLISSTKPFLTDKEILSYQMNPNAYKALKKDMTSQLLSQEELEGSDFLSAYIPLLDSRNDVIGYLSTPFFAKNEALNKQLSNLVVNILNIYFLLIMGGIILTYIISRQISKPLILIREKIANTVLLGENEQITYTRDDEIGQLVKQYNKMVLELQESANQMVESEREDAWREMAKQVAHEIKNPLTPMKLSMQHLQRAYNAGPSEKLDALFSKTSKLLIEQIDSLSNMASEFSNFAKMPEDKFEVFNISQILENTVDLFRQSENAEIRSKIIPNIYVNADPEQVKRIFNNLIKNAIQAIPEDTKGKIEIHLTGLKKSVKITIKDNGKGIPEENYSKVFVPNFSTKNSGMGLGLAICRKIVETAKGTISFTSVVNKGTTFIVNLPAVEKA
jgi:two-component system, NtrC family, nitrogen regulation sensor histidine kinase NtrY